MATPESKIVKKILTSLKDRGWLAWKVHTSQFGRIGIGDVLAVRGGLLASIEVKTPGKEPTASQDQWLIDVAKHGGLAGCAHDVDEALSIVESAIDPADEMALAVDILRRHGLQKAAALIESKKKFLAAIAMAVAIDTMCRIVASNEYKAMQHERRNDDY
ncbi:hypothetical protein [Kordiimonas sp.]|uniref:hypothetical protein n=1 Tax=Kordiimonas sp. TaxID=1970157 RepID=UPI003A953B51